MTFPTSDGRRLILDLYVPIERSIGKWPVGHGDRHGRLRAGICTASAYPCEEITAGELDIRRYADGLIEGSWRLNLPSGAKVESPSKASWSPQRPRPVCG